MFEILGAGDRKSRTDVGGRRQPYCAPMEFQVTHRGRLRRKGRERHKVDCTSYRRESAIGPSRYSSLWSAGGRAGMTENVAIWRMEQ